MLASLIAASGESAGDDVDYGAFMMPATGALLVVLDIYHDITYRRLSPDYA